METFQQGRRQMKDFICAILAGAEGFHTLQETFTRSNSRLPRSQPRRNRQETIQIPEGYLR
jgi:hypothetical protein